MLFQRGNQKYIKIIWSILVVLIIASMILAYIIPLFQ